jgi:hypothetical protein
LFVFIIFFIFLKNPVISNPEIVETEIYKAAVKARDDAVGFLETTKNISL